MIAAPVHLLVQEAVRVPIAGSKFNGTLWFRGLCGLRTLIEVVFHRIHCHTRRLENPRGGRNVAAATILGIQSDTRSHHRAGKCVCGTVASCRRRGFPESDRARLHGSPVSTPTASVSKRWRSSAAATPRLMGHASRSESEAMAYYCDWNHRYHHTVIEPKRPPRKRKPG